MVPIPDSSFTRIGRSIACRRRQLGYSQQSLAELLDISPTHMCRIEAGTRPGLELLVALARILGLSLDELFQLKAAPSDALTALLHYLSPRPEADRRMALLLVRSFFSARESELLLPRLTASPGLPAAAEKPAIYP